MFIRSIPATVAISLALDIMNDTPEPRHQIKRIQTLTPYMEDNIKLEF
jgi:hypothetical protein